MEKKDRYQEILHLPHHRSECHMPMAPEKRAAQFAPFDALAGFGDAVREVSAFKEQRIFASEDLEEELDRVIHTVAERLEERPEIRLTAFFPTEDLEYGLYRTETVRVKALDLSLRILTTEDSHTLALDDIIAMEMI